MNKLHLLSTDERKQFFELAAYEKKMSFEIIEKDYWVVWTLEKLFALKDLKNHLTFKGGTSLSKVYEVIDRFSEDIDLSIERDYFGFDEKNDPEKSPSKNKQRAMLEQLSKSCSKYVQGKMLTDLKAIITRELGAGDWQLVIDSKDPDGQTLFFEYPSIAPKDGYIPARVKIEMGARAEHWPVSDHKIRSYAKEALKEKIHEEEVLVRVLNVERTFWEKATILHQYAHLPADKKMPPRMSRHLYDFFCLLNSSTKGKALSEISLLERVAVHKSVYFASAWASYGTARKGTLKLSPPARILDELEVDYVSMDAMFFRKKPEWKAILKTIAEFEHEFNSK